MPIPANNGHYVNVRSGGVVLQKTDVVTVEKLLKTKTNDNKDNDKTKNGFSQTKQCLNCSSLVKIFTYNTVFTK